MIFANLRAFARDIRRDERASVSLELVLVVPLLVWTTIATMGFFDAFKTQFSVEKASSTIADLLSREPLTIDDTYIDGVLELFEALSYNNESPGVRLSVVRFDTTVGGYDLIWSQSRGDAPDAIDNTTFYQIENSLPLMNEGDRVILVQTYSSYISRYRTVIMPTVGDFQIEARAFISPRFTRTLCYLPPGQIDPLC